MATHLIAAPDPTAVAARGPWRDLSDALTRQAATLAERADLTVTCAPGAGRGAPGCFIPALAAIELDGVNLGHDPHTCDPSRPSDRERYPALWGVFVHEAAHARHSAWTIPTVRRAAAGVQAATSPGSKPSNCTAAPPTKDGCAPRPPASSSPTSPPPRPRVRTESQARPRLSRRRLPPGSGRR